MVRIAASVRLSQSRRRSAFLAGCVGTAVVAVSSQNSSSKAEKRKDGHHMEIYLMEKIAKKPYLNYHSASSAARQQQSKRFYRGSQGGDGDDVVPDEDEVRPKGVPSRLRLLAIDVPQFKREAFDGGVCKLPSEIFDPDNPTFADGVAPPKRPAGTLANNDRRRSSRKPIVQKSLAKQLYYCYGKHPETKNGTNKQREGHQLEPHDDQNQQPRIGVEILEASVMDLNPNNIRRTYTAMSTNWKKKRYRYDPGKYTDGDSSSDVEDDETGPADVAEAEVEEDELEQKSATSEVDDEIVPNKIDRNKIDLDDPDYERMAPWNQYQRYRTSWDGVDGEGKNAIYGSDVVSSSKTLNRASNKPHAVICDGAALQRVPGSLRYVSKICRDAGIPLYILNDPRSWGSQTHAALSDALIDMRKAVSENVIRHALDLREGSAFERGRLVGQLEKEMAWQAYDAARKTREALVDARKRLRRDDDNKQEDWSEQHEHELLKKLTERKVVAMTDEEIKDGTDKSGVKSRHSLKCSEAFLLICRRCVEKESKAPPTGHDN
ncbi:hypothetical protein ACHAWF_011737 [Thalassiosira exigua]